MKKVKYNRAVYSDETILQAIKVYQDYAIISVKFRSDYAVVTFGKCRYNEDQTVKEFENYMIGIENS